MKKPKILGIQFKYLGDTVVATPVLRAIKTHFAGGELHVLIPEAAVPLLEHIEWIDKVWSIPRKRDPASLVGTWPIIRQLRKERFDVTIDFAGNDRGAILSRIIGGRRRIGPIAPKGFFLRKHCYTESVEAMDTNRHETVRTWAIASVSGVPFPEDPTVEIGVNSALIDKARTLLDGVDLVCGISATQPKREWPLENWVRFYEMAQKHGIKMAFTVGKGVRENRLLKQIKRRRPDMPLLESIEPLDFFLAVLSQLRGFISPDAGPLHFAAGLGVPTIAMFGPTEGRRWAPLGKQHQYLQGGLCPCSGHADECSHRHHCITDVTPEDLYNAFLDMIGRWS